MARRPAADAMRITLRGLNRATLARQMLLRRERLSVEAAIERICGLQAQYSPSPYVQLWSRVDGLRLDDLSRALEERRVVKATLMRSTLHLVSARSYPMYDALTSDIRTNAWRGLAAQEGLDTSDLHARLLRHLREPRTLEEIHAFLRGRADEPAHGRWTIWMAVSPHGQIVHVPPSGTWRFHGKPRYLAARRWLPEATWPDAEEAWRSAARAYVAGFGPVSVADLGKWSAERRVSHVRSALEALGEDLVQLVDDAGRALVDLRDAPRPDEDTPAPVRFLAKWDNVVMGYDRRARILPERYGPVVGPHENGDLLPSVLVDGFVAAVWTTERTGSEAVLVVRLLERIGRAERVAIEDEGERLIRFVEPEAASFSVRVAASGRGGGGAR